MTEKDHIVEVSQLSVAFQNPNFLLNAVDDLDFTLNPGETLALLGESGCGKSLTSLALMRLLPMNAIYGAKSQVSYEKYDLLNLPECVMKTIRGKKIAMIFQEPMTALNPVLTIGQQLGETLKHLKLKRKELDNKLIELLKEVELPNSKDCLKKYPHQLSGGQKQRVVIAMALANQPEVLIADEPTTALDVTIQAQILQLLKKLQKVHQMSLLLITHDLTVVKAMADRVCVMYAGQVVEVSDIEHFFLSPRHPYVQQLLMSVPSMSKRNTRLESISGSVPSLGNMPDGCRFHPRCNHRFEPCDEIEPNLQRNGNRFVRCHLYPNLKVLPEIHTEPVSRELKNIANKRLLEVQHLSVVFQSGSKILRNHTTFKAVDDLSFFINKGKVLALVGESGCGKTTAARAIMGIQPVSSGQIIYDGNDVTTLKSTALKQFRKKVQIIFQDPFASMNPRMTIEEVLSEGLIAHGVSQREINKKIKILLDQVNIPFSSLTRYPHQFSGGQRQRICIARALATDPDLLICDEPTSALDISVQAQILNLLKDLQQEYHLTYLFITHNMAVVSYLADDVLVMKSGQAVEHGPAEELLRNPQSSYTKKLLGSVLKL